MPPVKLIVHYKLTMLHEHIILNHYTASKQNCSVLQSILKLYPALQTMHHSSLSEEGCFAAIEVTVEVDATLGTEGAPSALFSPRCVDATVGTAV